jgi:hypothetical protein
MWEKCANFIGSTHLPRHSIKDHFGKSFAGRQCALLALAHFARRAFNDCPHESDSTIVMITQNDHALICGLSAAHWGNKDFPLTVSAGITERD